LISLKITQVMFFWYMCICIRETREEQESARSWKKHCRGEDYIPRRYLDSNFIIEVARLSNVALLNLFRTSDTPVFLTSRRISRLFLYSLRPDN